MRRALISIIAGLATFGTTVFAVTSGAAEPIDQMLRSALWLSDSVKPHGRPTISSEALRDLTALGGGLSLTLATVGVLAMASASGRPHAGVAIGLGMLGASAVSLGLKEYLSRPRPPIVDTAAPVFTQSMPSGHAFLTLTFALSVVLVFVNKAHPLTRWVAIIIAALFALAVGWSRVALGVHWPSDVIAGWGLGLSCACLIAMGVEHIENPTR